MGTCCEACNYWDQEEADQMTRFTDKNVPIQCYDCPGWHFEEGFEAMTIHIKKDHPDYSEHEVQAYAEKWLELAWDRIDREDQIYYDERKLDRAIEADREFQTHKI